MGLAKELKEKLKEARNPVFGEDDKKDFQKKARKAVQDNLATMLFVDLAGDKDLFLALSTPEGIAYLKEEEFYVDKQDAYLMIYWEYPEPVPPPAGEPIPEAPVEEPVVSEEPAPEAPVEEPVVSEEPAPIIDEPMVDEEGNDAGTIPVIENEDGSITPVDETGSPITFPSETPEAPEDSDAAVDPAWDVIPADVGEESQVPSEPVDEQVPEEFVGQTPSEAKKKSSKGKRK